MGEGRKTQRMPSNHRSIFLGGGEERNLIPWSKWEGKGRGLQGGGFLLSLLLSRRKGEGGVANRRDIILL